MSTGFDRDADEFARGARAIIVYPVISGVLGLSAAQAGLFLGGTIHDVAQGHPPGPYSFPR